MGQLEDVLDQIWEFPGYEADPGALSYAVHSSRYSELKGAKLVLRMAKRGVPVQMVLFWLHLNGKRGAIFFSMLFVLIAPVLLLVYFGG